MSYCKLCKKEVENLSHEAEHFVMNFIKKQNPEWVEEDGGCPSCLAYYKRLDSVIEVVSSENTTDEQQ